MLLFRHILYLKRLILLQFVKDLKGNSKLGQFTLLNKVLYLKRSSKATAKLERVIVVKV